MACAGRLPVFIAALLGAAAVMCCMAVPYSLARAPHIAVTDERAYGAPEEKAGAEVAALAAARLALMEQVAWALLQRRDVGFGSAGDGWRFDMLALAYAAARYDRNVEYVDEGGGRGRVRVTLGLAGEMDRATLLDWLSRRDTLELYTGAVAREIFFVRAYDLLMAVAAVVPESAFAGPGEGADALPRREALKLAGGMRALDSYIAILPTLEGVWQEPRLVLTDMAAAIRDDPTNPLLHNAYGEAAMQAGRTHEALEAQSAAVRLDPAFARAYHARGVAYLAMNLPALAVADFSEAITLAPKNPRYRSDRAAAWRVRENVANMCADLYQACALGDCRDYQWAREEHSCP